MHTCMHVRVFCICSFTHAHTHTHTLRAQISGGTCDDVHIYVYTPKIYTCVRISKYTKDIYIYVHVWWRVRICIYMCTYNYIFWMNFFTTWYTGWRRLIGFPKLQIIFHKRATKYRSLLRKMTYEDKGSYESSPPRMTSYYPIFRMACVKSTSVLTYGVATISRLLQILGLFCRISSLL